MATNAVNNAANTNHSDGRAFMVGRTSNSTIAAAAGIQASVETEAVAFEFPDFEQDYEYLSLRTAHDYPIEAGSFVTGNGRAFPVSAFAEEVTEEQVPHSHALHARLRGRGPAADVGQLAESRIAERECEDVAGADVVDRAPVAREYG